MNISKIKIRSLVIIAVITFLIVTIFSSILIKEMETTQTKDTKQYLQEVGIQYKNSIVKQINGDFQTLRAIATVISSEDLELKSIIEKLRIENNNNPFLRMAFVDADYRGYVVDIDGSQYNDVDFSKQDFIHEALQGKDTISELFEDNFNAGKISCYAVPIYKDNVIIGVVTATLEADTFRDTINSEIFNNKGFAHVIDSDGDIIIHSSHKSADVNVENIFDEKSMSKELKSGILKDLSKGENGFYEVKRHGTTMWCSYVEIGINDWYIFTVVPKAVVNANFEQLSRVTLVTLAFVVTAASILVIVIIYAIRKSQQSIVTLAYYDNLTGLYNRNKFLSVVKGALKKRHDYAMIFLDIDNFKFYNELFGYDKGDHLLKEIAHILKESLYEGEYCYHDNADMFGALLFYDTKESLEMRVYQVIDKICKTQKEKKQRYNIVCNCGIKITEAYSDKMDIDIFMDRASMALNKAKGMHTNQVYFYDDEIHETVQMRNYIENKMHQALEDREFKVYLQPKINLDDGSLNSGEALIRWPQANGKMIYPDQFIPLFEKNGFITRVDMYMLEEVCGNLRRWLDLGYPVKPISVNQSRLLFYQEDYLEQIIKIINKYKIDPSLIILEITEGLMVENLDEIEVVLKSLKSYGFKLSLDDFGSGYSSLNTLKDLTIDELKIDKLFFTKSIDSIKSESILKCIFELAKELSIKTVAEGVETQELCLELERLGCDVIQGYYYDKPLKIDEFVAKYLKTCEK